MIIDALPGDRCAVLVIDFTTAIVDVYATDGRKAAAAAAALCDAARSAGALVIHVIPGHIDNGGKAVARTGDSIAELSPATTDRLFHKSGLGAFTASGLDAFLRRSGRDTLIVTGIATAGTVLSTTRAGYDLGYRMIVAQDACSDGDATVHAALTTRIHAESWIGLWRIAEVIDVADVVAALTSSPPAPR